MILPVALLACLVALASAEEPDTKIVYGYEAYTGQFPYFAGLRAHKQNMCGGSIVSPRFVLTAAHCLDKHAANVMDVEVGTAWRNQGQTYPVEWTTYHPQYDTSSFINDIGIVKIRGEIQYNQNVQPITMSHYDVYAFHHATIMGYGVNELGGQGSQYLRYLEVSVADWNSCAKLLGFQPNVDVCLQTPHGDGACSGDSGGPLVSQGYLIGLASRIFPPCGSKLDVYARVDVHLDWIYQYVY